MFKMCNSATPPWRATIMVYECPFNTLFLKDFVMVIYSASLHTNLFRLSGLIIPWYFLVDHLQGKPTWSQASIAIVLRENKFAKCAPWKLFDYVEMEIWKPYSWD